MTVRDRDIQGQDGLCGLHPIPSTSKMGCRCHIRCFRDLVMHRPGGREEYLSMYRAFSAIRAETGKHSERKGAMFVGDLMRSLEGKPGMSHEELTDMIGLLRTFHSEDHSSCLSIYDDHGWGIIFRGMYSPRPK